MNDQCAEVNEPQVNTRSVGSTFGDVAPSGKYLQRSQGNREVQRLRI